MTAPGDGDTVEPGVRWIVRNALKGADLCKSEEECPDRVYRCRGCGYAGNREIDECPGCGGMWQMIDVSHGPGCPKNALDVAMESPAGRLVARCFRLRNARTMGFTITLADVTEEEFRVCELIEEMSRCPDSRP